MNHENVCRTRSFGGNFLALQICVKDSENRVMRVCFLVLHVAENKEEKLARVFEGL